MLQMKPTEHLLGIIVQGDYNDFSELVESIYRITGLEESYNDSFFGVKNRLLGLCYDIRHAYQGDRNVVLVDNNMNRDKMSWHKIKTSEKNVYYSVEIFFPEAIFIAASVPFMYLVSKKYYGSHAKKNEFNIPPLPFSDYMRDKAVLDVLCSGFWQALGQVIDENELEKIIRLYNKSSECYTNYVTPFIDQCNIELLRTNTEKRRAKLRSIAKKIITKPQAYFNLEQEYKREAKEQKVSVYELKDPLLFYPEKID